MDSLTDIQATKIAWVLKLIRELDLIPSRLLLENHAIGSVIQHLTSGYKNHTEDLNVRQV